MNPKILIGLLVVVILAFVGFAKSPAIGVAILVIGAAVVILVAQKMGDGGGKKKVNEFIETDSTGGGGTTTAAPSEDSLPSWGGMTAWSGPTETAPTDTGFDAGYESFDTAGSGEGLASWDSGDSYGSDGGDTWGTWSSDTTTADEGTIDLDTEFEQTFGSGEYDALGGLDTAEELPTFEDEPSYGSDEPAYEEAEPAADNVFSFGSAPKPVNENVESADDIMAASAATEFHTEEEGAAENSELAKLLAKVQARLSAYE